MMERPPSSPTSTTSWRASYATTCAEMPPSSPLKQQRLLLPSKPQPQSRHSPSHIRVSCGHRSPFPSRSSATARGMAAHLLPSQLARSRVPRSPPLHLPRLAHFLQPAATLSSNVHPHDSHLRFPQPRVLSLPFPAYLTHRPRVLHSPTIRISAMRNTGQLCRNGRRRSRRKRLPLAVLRRRLADVKRPRPAVNKTRGGRTKRPRDAYA